MINLVNKPFDTKQMFDLQDLPLRICPVCKNYTTNNDVVRRKNFDFHNGYCWPIVFFASIKGLNNILDLIFGGDIIEI